ncbi:hypothetical protein CVIRNUC_002019 [Coccomyxa viridis]|uniref:Pachytene checkpoint protein 2 homolog n=1 Tax=Coccomyxa viridis TaxID=1274662 RepID=A0AAV1HUZ6_9CHLO|nr:hypothetical protein CVIRNUC_002019 [Coccomyxa viridis]
MHEPNSPASSDDSVLIRLEVLQASTSSADPNLVSKHVEQLLRSRRLKYSNECIPFAAEDGDFLSKHVVSISIVDTETDQEAPQGTHLLFWQVQLEIHVFQLSEEGPADDDEPEDDVSTYRDWLLPALDFHSLWDSLIYEGDIKSRLLQYASTAILFGEREVDPSLVSFNRTVLLHGPPGTGKTTLCKALAHKLTVRFSHRFARGQLIEVNAHSLFSKWFSESGKLVSRLFAKITELVEEEDSLVCVLLDEVESLTRARSAAVSGSEPADAIRAVNALLTQLDALKAHPNVLVLTTSNITGAIDLAFVDRADIKAYVGPPGIQARYEILRSCLAELQRVGVLSSSAPAPPLYTTAMQTSMACMAGEDGRSEGEMAAGRSLLRAAEACEGFSGRMLRKLPFLAHAGAAANRKSQELDCEAFAQRLTQAAQQETSDRGCMDG